MYCAADNYSPRDVGAGVGNELAKRGGAAHLDGRILVNEIGVLDHDDRVGAARNHAPGRDGGGPARLDVEDGSVTAHDDLAVEAKAARRGIARVTSVGRANGKAIDDRTIEGLHVDGRCHILREHAAERRRKWNGLRSKRRKLDLTGETGERVIGGSDSEKLLLPRCAADSCEGIIGRRRKRLTHGQGLTITSLCGG